MRSRLRKAVEDLRATVGDTDHQAVLEISAVADALPAGPPFDDLLRVEPGYIESAHGFFLGSSDFRPLNRALEQLQALARSAARDASGVPPKPKPPTFAIQLQHPDAEDL